MKMKCEENIKCNTLTRKFTTNKQGKFNQNEAMISFSMLHHPIYFMKFEN